MRLAHLSDLHLGFRAYGRTERGWNLRERDIAAAFGSALRAIARVRPDIVLITGDVFDHPDPPSTAFLTFSRGISRLRSRLPDLPILVVGGERDSPANPADPGPVAVLDALPGVEAASSAPRSVHFRGLGLHALLVPFRAVVRPPLPDLNPDSSARWNVLLIRGEPGGSGPSVPVELEAWSYVAIGGGHRASGWSTNTWTAGSLERPTLSPWAEATEERGFVTFDLVSGRSEFHPVRGRPVVDLAPVRVSSSDPDAGTRRLRELIQGVPGGVDRKIVRIRLRGDIVAPDEGVSAGLLNAVRRKASHLETRLQFQSAEDSTEEITARDSPEIELPGRSGARLSVSLGEPGVKLLTSASERWRTDIAAVLRTGDSASGEADERTPSVLKKIRMTPPADPLARGLWLGTDDPMGLLALLRSEGARGPSVPLPDERAAPARDERGNTPQMAASAEEIRALEGALVTLRADSIEATGDVEAEGMEWARERQDSDSKLQFYRERARELRGRIRALEAEGESAPCPTCGRTLGDGLPALLESLEAEWESVVQDGTWWKRRREQLDEKPEGLRRMEEHAVRLHAQVEASAEALERARARTPDAVSKGEEPSQSAMRGRLGDSMPGMDPVSDVHLREVLRLATNFLGRITQGAVTGVRADGQGLRLVDTVGRERPAGGAERAALRVAVRLAIWRSALQRGIPLAAPLVWELHDDAAEDLAVGTLDVLAEIDPDETVLLVASPRLHERLPERLREVIELRPTGDGPEGFHRVAGGLPALELV